LRNKANKCFVFKQTIEEPDKENGKSTELRRKLGLAGRKTVEEEFSAISQVPRVHEVFRSAIEGSPKCA
jgi:hypothetical protein